MATSITLYSKKAEKTATKLNLDKEVFGITEISHQLLSQAYKTYLANGRTNNAVTKTRGLVSGGGKKPWRQKGTGRARFGSSRNPIWKGGGVAFGPTGIENYSLKLNTKARKLAIKQALSSKLGANAIKFIESFDISKVSTKKLIDLINKLDANKGHVLIVVKDKTPEIILSARNVENFKVVKSSYLNVFDVLNADSIVIESITLEGLSAQLKSSRENK